MKIEPGQIWIKVRGQPHHSIAVGSKVLVKAAIPYRRKNDHKLRTVVKLSLFGEIRNVDLYYFLRYFERIEV